MLATILTMLAQTEVSETPILNTPEKGVFSAAVLAMIGVAVAALVILFWGLSVMARMRFQRRWSELDAMQAKIEARRSAWELAGKRAATPPRPSESEAADG
ncbi:MAG: hypothetical protein AAGB34_07840 [Planctomycetota bacterium]